MIKSNIFKSMAVAAFAILAGYNVYLAQPKTNDEMSDLLAANIEALTQNENPPGSSNSWDCWSSQKPGFGYWRCGSPCEWVDHFDGSGPTSKCFK